MIERWIAAAALTVIMASPGLAATAQQKQETCEFGASQQKLDGGKRKAYMAKCMSNKDSPRGKAVGGAAKPRT